MSAETVLSPQDHEHFLEHGFVVLHRAVPPDLVERAVAALESGAETPDFDPAAACTTDRVHQAIAELFGPQYPFEHRRGGHDMVRPHQPDATWAPPAAHVDDSYPTLMPNGWAVGTFIFLTPVRSRGGAFVYFAGSPLRYHQAMRHSYHCIKGAAALQERSGPFEEFLAEPGDALLFHHLMGHCGSTNVADPATRHALLARWAPTRRIVPGDKAFDQMSTIEKANSARYLEHRFGVDLQIRRTPDDHATETILHHGFAGLKEVVSYAVLHFTERAQLLCVERQNPHLIRRLYSDDFINWHDAGNAKIDAGNVCCLHLHQYGLEAILSATDDSGHATLFSSLDFERWEALAEVADCAAATPWYTYANYPSKVAGGQTVYSVSPSHASQVLCRWGEQWRDAARWTDQSVALRASEDHCIRDITIAAHFADSNCAFVVDLQTPEADSTLPYFVQPQDVAVADEPLRPLPCATATPPRQIRVFNRARSYWLVTYLRRHRDKDRLFWGFIDWNESPATLRELNTAAAFDAAKYIVGII